MAISLRRAVHSSRTLLQALRASSLSSHRSLSYLNSSPADSLHQRAFVERLLNSAHQFDTRRGFARGFGRGKKQQIQEEVEDEEEDEEEDEDEDEDEDEGGDLGTNVKSAAMSKMDAAIDSLSRELTKLRTGRASQGMLDHIVVEHYGVKTPLNRVAVVSVSDPKTLSVTPYDTNALKEIEKAIVLSPLGLNPKSDGQRLIVPIPPLTKEHMQAVCKIVTKSAEDVKQSIRRARQKALDSIKKAAPKKKDKDKSASSISADDAKRLEKDIDDITKKFIKTAEDMCKAKEKEIKAGS